MAKVRGYRANVENGVILNTTFYGCEQHPVCVFYMCTCAREHAGCFVCVPMLCMWVCIYQSLHQRVSVYYAYKRVCVCVY